jgi:hypothetical protein
MFEDYNYTAQGSSPHLARPKHPVDAFLNPFEVICVSMVIYISHIYISIYKYISIIYHMYISIIYHHISSYIVIYHFIFI